jgi:KipI family sensor histidine kinase inhibitor
LTGFPRVLPLGDSALTLEFGDRLDPILNARVRALDRALAERPFPGLRESVPTHRSLLVLYDPRRSGFEEVSHLLRERAAARTEEDAPGRRVTIPTLYGGENGPDLAEVAKARGLSEAELIARHCAPEYVAFMLGFTPGFAYLGPLPDALETPRRATPRLRVPAGSVAIAGTQTGIYPVASPGGWSLLGRTSLRLFDPTAQPPALILPGDRVRFQPVSELPERAASVVPTRATTAPVLEVLDPGLLTTIQDGGRFGHRRLGVTWAGPMDAPAHRAANRLLGNPEDAPALECTVVGPVLRFLAPARFALMGADLGAVLDREDLGAWPVPIGIRVLARSGNVLRFTGRRSGCRAYLALAGGIDVPPVLGSRSTDLGSGFGGLEGRALRAHDGLALAPPGRGRETEIGPPGAPSSPERVRVVLGPQADHLRPESVASFLAEPYTVGPASDRVGCRLLGPPLAHRGPAEILSDGMVMGSIQVPPDGHPIVMMADGPTTGGYPKIATVITADLPLLAQALPGHGQVRFAAVDVEEARRALPDL